MSFDEYNERFNARFEQLSCQQRQQLGLSICKKLFFDYTRFLPAIDACGNADDLLDAILLIEAYVAGAEQKGRLTATRDAVEDLKLSIQDFEITNGLPDGCYASNCAYEACEAVTFTLDAILDNYTDLVAYAAGCLLKNVYASLYEELGLLDEEIYCHPRIENAQRFLLGENRD